MSPLAAPGMGAAGLGPSKLQTPALGHQRRAGSPTRRRGCRREPEPPLAAPGVGAAGRASRFSSLGRRPAEPAGERREPASSPVTLQPSAVGHQRRAGAPDRRSGCSLRPGARSSAVAYSAASPGGRNVRRKENPGRPQSQWRLSERSTKRAPLRANKNCPERPGVLVGETRTAGTIGENTGQVEIPSQLEVRIKATPS